MSSWSQDRPGRGGQFGGIPVNGVQTGYGWCTGRVSAGAVSASWRSCRGELFAVSVRGRVGVSGGPW